MKTYLGVAAITTMLTIGAVANAEVVDGVEVGEVLTGDVKLACEATLCLAGGQRPEECTPSLNHYFNINKKKWKDTLKAGKDFLKLCPASNEQGMPELSDAIVGGAGRCEADTLNKELIQTKTFMVCNRPNSRNDDGCQPVIKYRISSNLPSYCKTYFSNQYTDFNIIFSGSSEWQLSSDFGKAPSGKWVTQ